MEFETKETLSQLTKSIIHNGRKMTNKCRKKGKKRVLFFFFKRGENDRILNTEKHPHPLIDSRQNILKSE